MDKPPKYAECRKCKTAYVPTWYQIKKSDFICPKCRSKYDREWRARRKTEGRPVVSSKTWDADKYTRWKERYYSDPEVKARIAARMRTYRKNPELRYKNKARWALNKAIASGKILREPCELCGEGKAEAHHEDYAKPFDVRWLCRRCHRKEHVKVKG